jgi:phospholipase C
MRRSSAIAAALAATLLAAAPSALASGPSTPIEHFVVLMQENHSFDNYFGTYPGADGIPEQTCMPVRPRGREHCVRPFRLGDRAAPDLSSDERAHRLQYAGGRMDGFVGAATLDRQRVERSVMAYYDDRDLPYYWAVAKEHVLFDRFFAASPGGSVPNHMYWVAGRPGEPLPQGGYGDLPTIFDRLDERGVSWKFYVEDYDPRLNVQARGRADTSAQAVRVPLLNYPRFVRDRESFNRIVDLEEYYEDLENGHLPQVAYIAPSGSSEHPPGRVQSGESLVRSLITALMRSESWDSSAFMWTYDNWGGWFDHVQPPAGYGFRVPALLVSPYARRGHVDGTRLDTTSILRFIEDNWGLRSLAARDARANSLLPAFDFSRAPRRPALVAAGAGVEGSEAPRWMIYLSYGAAAIFAAWLVGRGVLRSSRWPQALSVVVLVSLTAPPAVAQAPGPSAVPSTIQTVPKVPGMRFSLNGAEFEADPEGRASPPWALGGAPGSLKALDTDVAPGVRARLDRWYLGRGIAAINLFYRVRPTFVDLNGEPVDPQVVRELSLRGSHGRRHVLGGGRSHWLQGNRVVPESQGRKSTALSWAAEKVVVAGSTVVHRGQQRFFPSETRKLQLRLSLYAARLKVRDALLGFPIGSAVKVTYPDGQEQRQPLGPGAEVTLRQMPRGDYRMTVDALGISSPRPVALSRDQEVDIRVISWLDIVIVLLGLASVGLALLFVRRPARA